MIRIDRPFSRISSVILLLTLTCYSKSGTAQHITRINPSSVILRGIAISPGGNQIVVGDSGVVLDGSRIPFHTNIPASVTLYAAAYAGPSRIVIAGSDGTMSRTSNSGSTWTPVDLGMKKTVRALTFNGARILIAVGDSGMVLRSTDYGVSWIPISIGTTKQLNAVTFCKPSTGTLVGNDTAMFQTLDSGRTWTALPFPFTALPSMVHHIDFPAVAMLGPDTIVVSPERPVLPLYIIRGQADPEGVDPFSVFRAQPNSGPVYGIVHVGNPHCYIALLAGDDMRRQDTTGHDNWLNVQMTWSGDADGNIDNASYRWRAGAVAKPGSGGYLYQVGDNEHTASMMSGGGTFFFEFLPNFLDLSFSQRGPKGYYIASNGDLRFTTDGGVIWNSLNGSTVLDFTKALNTLFTDGNNFLMLCGWDGAIARSEDGGITYTYPDSHTTERLHGIAFATPDTGVIVGDFGFITRSTDAGITWEAVNNIGTAFLKTVAFVDANVGIAGGTDGTILRTTDRGNSWADINSVISGTQVTVRKVQPLADGTVLDQATSDLLLSTDSGLHWAFIESPGDSLGMSFFDRQTGIIATRASSSALMMDTVYFANTSDGGAHWTPFTVPMSTANRILFHWINEKQVTLFGVEGFIIVVDFSSGSARLTRLAQSPDCAAYPNPFSSRTSVHFTTQQSGRTEVRVVNLLGEEVATLFSGEMLAGEHSFVWNAKGVAEGTYECIVWSHGKVLSVPVELQR